MRWRAIFLATLLLAGNALAAAPHFPALTGRVVDDAHVLSAQTQQSLTDMLAEHEQRTTQQVVVVTLPSLQGYDIADYGYQLGREWGIGQKGTNNGVLFIIAPHERRVRIEVGYGLEGTLTDAMSANIIQNIVLPDFRAGQLQNGVVQGTTAILSVLSGHTVAAPLSPDSSPVHLSANTASFSFALILFAFVFFRLSVLMVFLFTWIITHLLNFLGLPGPLNRLERIEKTRFGHHFITGPGAYVGSSGGGFGGGFSGGGGGFGGGGASGGW